MNCSSRLMIFSLALLVSACAHEPKQVEASRPLVSQNNTLHKRMPEKSQQLLNEQVQGMTFIASGVIYTVEERYISALGNTCMTLSYEMKNQYLNRTVVCKENNQWYQVPQLEQASVSSLIVAK